MSRDAQGCAAAWRARSRTGTAAGPPRLAGASHTPPPATPRVPRGRPSRPRRAPARPAGPRQSAAARARRWRPRTPRPRRAPPRGWRTRTSAARPACPCRPPSRRHLYAAQGTDASAPSARLDARGGVVLHERARAAYIKGPGGGASVRPGWRRREMGDLLDECLRDCDVRAGSTLPARAAVHRALSDPTTCHDIQQAVLRGVGGRARARALLLHVVSRCGIAQRAVHCGARR